MDFDAWAAMPIWADARACAVSLQNLPMHGGRFKPRNLGSEAALLASKLARLQPDEIALFEGAARFPDHDTEETPGDA